MCYFFETRTSSDMCRLAIAPNVAPVSPLGISVITSFRAAPNDSGKKDGFQTACGKLNAATYRKLSQTIRSGSLIAMVSSLYLHHGLVVIGNLWREMQKKTELTVSSKYIIAERRLSPVEFLCG